VVAVAVAVDAAAGPAEGEADREADDDRHHYQQHQQEPSAPSATALLRNRFGPTRPGRTGWDRGRGS
jgi:hypothetical protein